MVEKDPRREVGNAKTLIHGPDGPKVFARWRMERKYLETRWKFKEENKFGIERLEVERNSGKGERGENRQTERGRDRDTDIKIDR